MNCPPPNWPVRQSRLTLCKLGYYFFYQMFYFAWSELLCMTHFDTPIFLLFQIYSHILFQGNALQCMSERHHLPALYWFMPRSAVPSNITGTWCIHSETVTVPALDWTSQHQVKVFSLQVRLGDSGLTEVAALFDLSLLE